MRMITLTSAYDGAKMYINPEYIEVVCSDRDDESKTVVGMVDGKDEYYLVKESPDAVAELAQRKDDAAIQAPSEPERKSGKWIWYEDGVDWGLGAWCCSECGRKPETWWESDKSANPLRCAGGRFCGNCGTYMIGTD